ncbi:MAG TPA: periplasmic heavy metal sensor [Dongiaceae bacterium]|nr:periplasmic heavy metal sensor [Dongiaceae bacterium]
MKTPKLFFCFTVIAIAVANFATSAQTQTPGPRQQGFGAGDRFFPALNRVLTDDQRKTFRAAIETQSEKIQPLEEKMRESRRAVLDEIASGKFDESVARQNAEESAKAEVELTVIFAKALSQMQPPLSAQQIEQMKNFQPGQQSQSAPQTEVAPRPKMDLPPPLPRDSNDLPVITPQK